MIKDSGERRQFYDADGKPLAVRDMSEGKGRMDLLPWAAIMEVYGRTDEPHLLAAAWNLLWCIQMELKHPELCDVPWTDSK